MTGQPGVSETLWYLSGQAALLRTPGIACADSIELPLCFRHKETGSPVVGSPVFMSYYRIGV